MGQTHFKQLVFHKGKPCQAQKRRYLLSLLKLPGSAVLVISYKWIYNQSYRTPISQLMDTYGVNFTMGIHGYAAVMHIKVSSTAPQALFPSKKSWHQANIRATGPHFALGPAIYPGAGWRLMANPRTFCSPLYRQDFFPKP